MKRLHETNKTIILNAVWSNASSRTFSGTQNNFIRNGTEQSIRVEENEKERRRENEGNFNAKKQSSKAGQGESAPMDTRVLHLNPVEYIDEAFGSFGLHRTNSNTHT